MPLADFAAVCLVDPPPLPAAAWQALVDFAEAGGGVGIFLGRHARSDEMNRRSAQQLLPAKLRWQSREATYLRPVAVEHPALAELRELADAVPWSEFPVFQYWELEAGARAGACRRAVRQWQAGARGAADRRGPRADVDDAGFRPGARRSVEFAADGPDPWPFLALANGIARIPGRRGRRAAQLPGRADGRAAACRRRSR